MYQLDTNVVSELRKAKSGRIDRHVRSWARKVEPEALYLSPISILELLRSRMENHVLPAFAERILPVDTTVAKRCAELHVPSPLPGTGRAYSGDCPRPRGDRDDAQRGRF